MTASITDRIAALPEGGDLMDVFTADEFTAGVAACIKSHDFEDAIEMMKAMTVRFPREAELLYKTIEVGAAVGSGSSTTP